MRFSDRLKVHGVCTATHICKDKNGNEVPISDAVAVKSGNEVPRIVKSNLVVNTGRQILAQLLGGLWQSDGQVGPYIDRITLGDGQKANNLPNLTDTGLVNEIQKLDGTVSGTFLLNDPNDVAPDVVFPARSGRFPTSDTGWGSANGTVTIDGNGDTILEDNSVNFTSLFGGGESVQLTDQVTLNTSSSNPLVLGVKEVVSATQLKLHNPNGYETPVATNIQYRIDVPGTQMLVSKLVNGNSFVKADWGTAVLIKEAGLLFNNGVLFNRVVFAPQSEDVGVLLQSDETNGVEISVRFEWLVTF